MLHIRFLLEGWISREPTASLWLGLITALLFCVTIGRSLGEGRYAGVWIRSLFESLAKALAFAALAGAFFYLLSSSYSAFSQVYSSFTTGGSLSNQAWQRWRDRFGGYFVQEDLQVVQYVIIRSVEVIQPVDPAGLPKYRHVESEQRVLENSIAGFDGRVTMNLVDPAGPADAFNGYALAASFDYIIVNPAGAETRVSFRFPLASGARAYRDVSVRMNGRETPAWRVDGGAIVWEGRMSPGQRDTVSIEYAASGMDGFVFNMPEARPVTDFLLTLVIDPPACCLLTVPENGGVQMTAGPSPQGEVVNWTIERAVLAARLGADYGQGWPYAPYQKMIQVLPYGARASMLFLCMFVVTLMILGQPVRLPQVALAAGVFAIPFLVLMAGGLPHPAAVASAGLGDDQVKMLPLMAILMVLPATFVLRSLPRLPRILILVLMLFFLAGFPFFGLAPTDQKRNAMETMLQAGMIAYVFLLTLIVRVHAAFRSKVLMDASNR